MPSSHLQHIVHEAEI